MCNILKNVSRIFVEIPHRNREKICEFFLEIVEREARLGNRSRYGKRIHNESNPVQLRKKLLRHSAKQCQVKNDRGSP